MNPWVRMLRIGGTLALIAGGSAAGFYLEGALLGIVGLLVGGCVAVATLFLTAPTCDECGSPRVNRIGNAPLKCGRCGYVHGDSTMNVVITDSARMSRTISTRQDGRRWIRTLRAVSVLVFLLGVGIVAYSVVGLTVPNPLDPETWDAAETWRIFVSIFGLALNTVGLMIYIISYRLS